MAEVGVRLGLGVHGACSAYTGKKEMGEEERLYRGRLGLGYDED